MVIESMTNIRRKGSVLVRKYSLWLARTLFLKELVNYTYVSSVFLKMFYK